MNATYVAVTHVGVLTASVISARDNSSSDVCVWRLRNSRRNQNQTSSVDATIAMAARQPKWEIMNAESHCQGLDTIRTGGAAKWVSVPPMETLTNRSPSVAYFRGTDGPRT